jgi:GTP-binding protein
MWWTYRAARVEILLKILMSSTPNWNVFLPSLPSAPCWWPANKCDIATNEQRAAFSDAIKARGLALFEISAATTQGVDALIKAIAGQLSVLPPVVRYQPDAPLPAPSPDDRSRYTIEKRDGAYHVEADWLDYMLGSVNMEDYESLQYLQKTLRTVGIIDRLEEMGIQEGETVCLNDFAFDFIR